MLKYPDKTYYKKWSDRTYIFAINHRIPNKVNLVLKHISVVGGFEKNYKDNNYDKHRKQWSLTIIIWLQLTNKWALMIIIIFLMILITQTPALTWTIGHALKHLILNLGCLMGHKVGATGLFNKPFLTSTQPSTRSQAVNQLGYPFGAMSFNDTE